MRGSLLASWFLFVSREDPEVTNILTHTDGCRAASLGATCAWTGHGRHSCTRVCTHTCRNALSTPLQVTRHSFTWRQPLCLEMMVIKTVLLLKF